MLLMKLYYSLLGMNKADCFEILSTGNEVSKAPPNQLGKPLLFFHSFFSTRETTVTFPHSYPSQ